MADKEILNKMHEVINSMAAMLNELSSCNSPERELMNKSWTKLSIAMTELNQPPALITAELVKRLREHTGEGLMASKKALVRSNGNFNDAVEYLRTSGNINNFCTDQNRPALGQRHN